MTDDEAVVNLVKLEFKCFDKTENEGGRAYCQNDYPTFYAMRASQYRTWTREMVDSLTKDFNEACAIGRNLVTEKYARMMKSTAPKEYEAFCDKLPKISKEKEDIVEEVVKIEVSWMEQFAKEHPNIHTRARNIHTYEDTANETSAETYLRGELLTYSDETLMLYARHIVDLYRQGKNIIEMTMYNTIKLYGYNTFDEVPND